MKYFQCLLKELAAGKGTLAHFFNVPQRQVRQSSVAIIFRVGRPESHFERFRKEIQSYYAKEPLLAGYDSIAPTELVEKVLQGLTDQDFEVLLTERTSSSRDINSGFIVFPGGKCEEQESDLCACLRETQEEVGLRLIDQSKGSFTEYLNCYLGKLPNNFFYRKQKGADLYVTCHVFLLLHDKPTLIMNAEEVVESRWVPFMDLLNPEKVSILRNHNDSIVQNAVPKALQFLKGSIIRNVDHMEHSVIDTGFQRMKLWGLTLYLWLHLCRVIQYRLTKELPDQTGQLDTFIKLCDGYSIKFKWYYLPGILFKRAAEHWHYKNRTLASYYPQRRYPYVRNIMASLLLVAVVAAACWYCLAGTPS